MTTDWEAKVTNIDFSQFRRQEAQDQGAGRVGIWGGHSSWFADVHLLLLHFFFFPWLQHVEVPGSGIETQPEPMNPMGTPDPYLFRGNPPFSTFQRGPQTGSAFTWLA